MNTDRYFRKHLVYVALIIYHHYALCLNKVVAASQYYIKSKVKSNYFIVRPKVDQKLAYLVCRT